MNLLNYNQNKGRYPVYCKQSDSRICVIHSDRKNDITYIEYDGIHGLKIIYRYNESDRVSFSITTFVIGKSLFYSMLENIKAKANITTKILIPRYSYYKT